MHVERTFTVATPVETTFDYLSDFENTNEWDPGTVTTSRTEGDGSVGTTYANTSEFLGRKTELTYETIELDRPKLVRFRGQNKTVTTYDTLTTSAVGEKTEIHYRADFDFKFPLNVLAPIFIKGKLSELADETVAQLSEALAHRA